MWGNIAGAVGLTAGMGGFGNLGSMFKGAGVPGSVTPGGIVSPSVMPGYTTPSFGANVPGLFPGG